ncbi:MAG: hypothetical protein WAT12_00065 [Candidatus Nitrotoga sp.]
MSDRFLKLRWAASDTQRTTDIPESRPSTMIAQGRGATLFGDASTGAMGWAEL